MVEVHARPERIDRAPHPELPCSEEHSTAVAMRDLSTAVQRVRLALARRGHLGSTDLLVLEQLVSGPVGFGELAQRTGVTKSAISNIANRLIEAGLVSRRFPAGDRRRTLLELTEAGSDEMASSLGPVFAVLEALDRSVTPDELQVIRRYLRDATRAYEAVEALVARSSPEAEQH